MKRMEKKHCKFAGKIRKFKLLKKREIKKENF